MSDLPRVKLDNFEGPFDLLVELARARKLDLSQVSLATMTEDFLRFLAENQLSAAMKGDFLVTAATLLLIKARQVLPTLQPAEEAEVEQLTEHLRMYQLYRDQALALIKRWDQTRLLSASWWSDGVVAIRAQSWPDLSQLDLAKSFQRFLSHLPKPLQPRAHLVVLGRSLQDCIDIFTARVKKFQQVIFQEAVGGYTRQDTAVSFLAILELAKRDRVKLDQQQPFDKLLVKTAN